jgi:hypothetical protein
MIKKKNFHLAGGPAITLLRQYAPYKGGNIALRGLHDLDICDKHEALVPGVTMTASPVLRLRDDDGTLNPVVVGDPVTSSDLKVIFPAETPFAGQKVIPTLEGLVELTERIIEAFAALSEVP